MSNEIFNWMPHLLDYDREHEFKTTITEYETGAEQRSYKRSREIGFWKMNFIAALIRGSDRKRLEDSILEFFRARKGAYDNFWLPSWELELSSTGSANDNELWFTSDPSLLGFSATDGEPGNYLYVCNRYLKTFDLDVSITDEVKQVSSITQFNANNWYITLAENLTNSYSNGAKVQKAFKVRFVQDKLARGFEIPYVWKNPIEFKEDLSALYTQLGEL